MVFSLVGSMMFGWVVYFVFSELRAASELMAISVLSGSYCNYVA